MLNAASKQGIAEMLSSLDDSSVLSLASTVTQGLLKKRINSRTDAINAILNYSADALAFLRRKIITREVLLAYLHKKNVSITLPATKIDLIQAVARFWEVQYTQEIESNVDSGSISTLAEQFTKWFYSMLNQSEMSPEHFYSDAKLQVNINNNGEYSSEVVEGDPQQIVTQLLDLKSKFNLTFNPNTSGSGVQGKVDPHGLVMVLVCGTLHALGNCVGVFEQVFGLVRDPLMQNNWKIKMSEINLKSQSEVNALPTLENRTLLSLT